MNSKVKQFIKCVLIVMVITLPVSAQTEEPVIPVDKQYHIGAGVVFGAWGTFCGNSCLFTPEKSAVIGMISATAAGLGKELWDEAEYQVADYGTGFDWADLGATMIGGVIGTGLSYASLKIFYHYKPRVFIGSVQDKMTVGVKIKF